MTDSIQTTMPVAPAYGGNMGGFGGFGGDNGWILIFFLLCLGGGWGNGWGNNGSGSIPGYSQSNDFSNLERENDIIRSDICNNFAAVNQALANGFQGIQTSFANAELSRSNTQAALMGQMYNMSMDSVQRACDAQAAVSAGFAQTNYNLADQGCNTRNTIQNTTRDVIDANNANTRAILDTLNAQRLEDKNAQIADLTAQLNAARLSASQFAQNQYLVSTLRPYPIPTFTVVPPGTLPDAGAAAVKASTAA